MAALRQEKARQARLKLALGMEWQDAGLVCPGRKGGPWHPSSFRSGFRGHLERRGIPPVRPHDLRHSNASILLGTGVPVKVVSQRLGHARQSTTTDLYSHMLPGESEQASALLEELLRRDRQAGEEGRKAG